MRNVQRVILIIIAATVFLTGMGVTVINFCCSSCGEQTLIMTQKHTCCSQERGQTDADIHKSCCAEKVSIEKKTSANTFFDDAEHCSSSRLSIDIDASSFRPQVASPFVWLSATLPNTLGTTVSLTLGDTKEYTQLKTPTKIPPREYLSLIRVLII
ncbi:hypothetical protein [Dysgonomonas sp. Marseille-P4361]|uniref:hypothetical protein n=1 Tax=Dysgonomonas sp. Marseille-P4361 TaxID=2161820 RepID=UPI000D5545AF|nr:hypothetical protein [Dysgonomonas sp. Marseille-P4361]